MNYSLHYQKLISRAKTREPLTGYKERHHIVPRCMGGTDDKENIVELTAREHFVAHLLLTKMHPDSHKLSYAAIRMTGGNGKQLRSNRLYEWLKIEHSKRYSLNETGKKYYNNGAKNIKLRESDIIPDGFVKGRSFSPTKGTTHNRKSGGFKNSSLQKELATRRWEKVNKELCANFGVTDIFEAAQIVKSFKESSGRYWVAPILIKYPFLTRTTVRRLSSLKK